MKASFYRTLLKTTFLFSILSLFFQTGLSYAQEQSIVIIHAHQFIDSLTSPYMHGRGYVYKGDSLAADYLKKQFSDLGLKSFGKDYYQHFNFNVNTFPGNTDIESDNNKLLVGEDFILKGNSGSVKGKFELVRYSSKQLDSKKEKKKFKNIDFTNKVVLLNKSGFEKIDDGKNLLAVFESNLFKAKAVLFIEPTKLTAGFAQKESEYSLVTILESSTNKLGDSIYLDIQNKLLTNYKSQNVIGFIPGSTYPDSFIVFSAHYDHLGRMGGAYFPGANDNASGCAMLLTLADYYKKNPPKYSIALMAFGAEEVGLLGSKYHVENPLFDLKKIKFLVNIDIMGTGDEGIKVVNATVHKTEFDTLVSINKVKNLLPAVQPRGKAANSDHYFFEEAGVKTFFIYTLGGIKAYHDIFDKAETLPLTKFEEAYKLLIEFAGYLQKQ